MLRCALAIFVYTYNKQYYSDPPVGEMFVTRQRKTCSQAGRKKLVKAWLIPSKNRLSKN